jgi:hypothetical protein
MSCIKVRVFLCLCVFVICLHACVCISACVYVCICEICGWLAYAYECFTPAETSHD